MNRTSGRGCLINLQLGAFYVKGSRNTRFFGKPVGFGAAAEQWQALALHVAPVALAVIQLPCR